MQKEVKIGETTVLLNDVPPDATEEQLLEWAEIALEKHKSEETQKKLLYIN